MKTRKVPKRKCLGCFEMKPKKELVRVVKNKEGNVSLDLTGKKSGRGAYICPNRKCFEKARNSKQFERALSSKIPDEVYNKIGEELPLNE